MGARRTANGDRRLRAGAGAPQRRERQSVAQRWSMTMTSEEYSLAGEVAIVTGSGRGLGHAIAVRLAELGASVAVHDLNERAPAEYGEFPDLAASHADVARFGTPTCVITGDISQETTVTG